MPKTFKDIIKIVEADGWKQVSPKGSHRKFKHPTKPGCLIIAPHKLIVAIGTEKSILKQAGID
ncbi:type II toxin-antitoxin system HicA family toxin [Anaerovibrio sp.]|uniref:type II toxin-antitoxin system HicA family toxin n=1 Tax=Anaerovibrio sp. TaxID=1872532 RepID=UPI00388E28B4